MPHERQVIAEAWSIAHGRDEVGQDEPKVMQLSEVKIFRGTGTDYLVRDRVYQPSMETMARVFRTWSGSHW